MNAITPIAPSHDRQARRDAIDRGFHCPNGLLATLVRHIGTLRHDDEPAAAGSVLLPEDVAA